MTHHFRMHTMTRLVLALAATLLSACATLTPRHDCSGGVETGTGCMNRNAR
jgi:hypothetical protein